MKYFKIPQFLSILLLLSPFNLIASEYVPDVYEDDYIIVRSGIAEAGKKPVNLGDKLSLIIEAEFPSDEVIIESLDEQLFERSWGSEKGINLIDAPVISSREMPGGISLVRSIFHFQVLDCPADLTSCRGNKVYELPVITVGYQIIDNGGNVVNNKSVRFNTNPSQIVVLQALDIRGEGGLDDLSAYIGGSGYPTAMNVPEVESASMWPVLTGGLIFLASFFPVLLTGNAQHRPETRRRLNTRWESVLAQLSNDGKNLSDEEYSDLLRRSTTWYCLDELSINPYDWLGHYHGGDNDKDVREFFIDVLNQEGISNENRQEFLNRFNAITAAAGFQSG
ncbi:MAG: hypothetical protein HKN08_01360 [Gammaproteobacteria bacterium]|nr:hypothetical protein [Gammaproteobacteria bacterium]